MYLVQLAARKCQKSDRRAILVVDRQSSRITVTLENSKLQFATLFNILTFILPIFSSYKLMCRKYPI